MAEEVVGVRYGIRNLPQVTTELDGLNRKAAAVDARAKSAEQSLTASAGRFAKTAALQIGRQAIAFTAQQVLTDVVSEQVGSGFIGFLAGTGTAVGFQLAQGNVPGAAITALTGITSQILQKIRESEQREKARLEKEEKEKARVAERIKQIEADFFERQMQLSERLREIESRIRPEIEDLAWTSWQYR